VIAAIARNEVRQRRVLLGLAFVLVCLIAATMPFWFAFSLRQAALHPGNASAADVLRNFRSYAFFLESTWLARGLGRTLMLLALVAGAGAIAGEREARTLPLLVQSAMSLGTVAAIKYVAIATWLFLVAFSSAGVLTALSLSMGHPTPAVAIVIASGIAWANAVAFLAIVAFASALARRTIVAAGLALVFGVLVAAAFAPFGVNATALGAVVVGPGGALDTTQAIRAFALAIGIATIASVLTLGALDLERR